MADVSMGAICAGPIFLVIGLALMYAGTSRFTLYRKIQDTPTSKVRSAALGLVELSGKAICLEGIESPVSRARCVYWELRGQYYQSGKNGGWKDLFSKKSSRSFYLEDETGKMLILPEGAEIDIPPDLSSTGYLTQSGFLGMKRSVLDPKVLSYLETDPEAKTRFESHSSYELRIIESFIAEGDPLFVFGDAMPGGMSSFGGHEDLLVRLGRDKVMFISDSNEYRALRDIRNSMVAGLAVGLLFSAIGLYALLTTFGV